MSRGPWRRANPPTQKVQSIDDLPAICTPVDAGLLLSCTPETVTRLANVGVIRGFRVGKLWRFRREDLSDYVERQLQATKAALR